MCKHQDPENVLLSRQELSRSWRASRLHIPTPADAKHSVGTNTEAEWWFSCTFSFSKPSLRSPCKTIILCKDGTCSLCRLTSHQHSVIFVELTHWRFSYSQNHCKANTATGKESRACLFEFIKSDTSACRLGFTCWAKLLSISPSPTEDN